MMLNKNSYYKKDRKGSRINISNLLRRKRLKIIGIRRRSTKNVEVEKYEDKIGIMIKMRKRG